MSQFYGTVRGGRGQASRCGGRDSGIETYAASWAGAIRVCVFEDPRTGEERALVEQVPWHGAGVNGRTLYCGPVGRQYPTAGQVEAIDLLRRVLHDYEVHANTFTDTLDAIRQYLAPFTPQRAPLPSVESCPSQTDNLTPNCPSTEENSDATERTTVTDGAGVPPEGVVHREREDQQRQFPVR